MQREVRSERLHREKCVQEYVGANAWRVRLVGSIEGTSAWCRTSHILQLLHTIPTPSMIVWESLDRSAHSMVETSRFGNAAKRFIC